MYTANQIADFFISKVNTESGDTISHLKLQKLVYYAQAWHYTLFDQPLFSEKIEAWMHGPVIRSIYDRFKNNQVYSPIDVNSVDLEEVTFPNKTIELLNDVNNVYGEHTSGYLEDLTHSEDPWIEARGGLPDYVYCETEITLDAMKKYYSKKLHGTEAK